MLTLSFTTLGHRDGEVSIFVKRQAGDRGFKETPHYEYLNRNQLPVPKMYGSLLDDDQMEILFLEDVLPDTEGSRLLDTPDHFSEFLSLAARINALRPQGNYGDGLYYFGWERRIARGMHAVDEIWCAAGRGRLGRELGTVCSPIRREALLYLGESLASDVSTMERGYTHNEYRPEQIGRKPGTGEMVVFDLRTTGQGPRFTDVAPWLGVPNRVVKAEETPVERADHYLHQYLAAGGAPVSLEMLVSEARLLWQASALAGLSGRCDHALAGSEPSTDHGPGRVAQQDRLLGELSQLLDTLPGR